MIHFITGAVNIGKSTYLLGIYRSLDKGDGFYNRKIYRVNSIVGQEIVHLATEESRLFSYRDGFIPQSWPEECHYSNFSFSRDGLEFGRGIIKKAIFFHLEPLFIDEIGPLELQGQGFHDLFSSLIDTPIETYVVVRQNSLDNVIRKFGIRKFAVINLTEK